MALSQLQCLDDNHVNLRTNESKPEFLYSEEQRLALETLLDGGRELFQEFLKSSSARSFLSELEVTRFTGSVEVFCPDGPVRAGGDADEAHGSLQYWPDRSDTSLPELDMGWPDSGAYRGVTRAHVYAQPPLEGDAHIKEVVRKSIAQAQKVIAVVMDLFTDVDIFQDLLDASLKRKVAVYIILETTGVPHFLQMCERAAMHTGHLKNLRVRSIRGAEFFTRSSKKICGTQSQKFMFVDGDKTLSGSYSFTWTASRLDRNIITMLTGQAVDAFDKLFRELYAVSNGVNLSKIKLDNEPTTEPAPQSAPALLPSSTMALRLINPKYALVSSGATANSNSTPQAPEPRLAKNSSVKHVKELPEPPPVHPGLLHLEKANMIEYLPVWPEPDPPSDVIGFINIRDYNKPLQAHLMRSELFEVSQAIRFKDPFQVPEKPLIERASLQPKVVESSSYPLANELINEQPISIQPQASLEEKNRHARPLDSVELPLSSPNEQTSGFLSSSNQSKKDSALVHGLEKLMDMSLLPREEIHAFSTKPEPLKAESKLSILDPKTTHTPTVHFETTSVQQTLDTPTEIPKYASNFSSTSDEYFECSDFLTVDSEFEGMVNKVRPDSRLSEQDCHTDDCSKTVTQSQPYISLQLQQLALAASSFTHESGPQSLNEHKTDVTKDPQEGPQEQCVGQCDATGMALHRGLDKTEAKHEAGFELQADEMSEELESGRESLKEPDETQQTSGIQTQCDDQPVAEMAFHWESDKTETQLDIQADRLSEEHESGCESLKVPDEPLQPSGIQTQCDAQPVAEMAFHWESDKTETGLKIQADVPSEELESGCESQKEPDEPHQPSGIQTQDKTETGLDIQSNGLSEELESSHESLKEPDEPHQPSGIQTQCDAQSVAEITFHWKPDKTETCLETLADTLFKPKPPPKDHHHEVQDDSSVLAHEINPLEANLLKGYTDTQAACKEKVEGLDRENEEPSKQELDHKEHSVVNYTLGFKPVEANKSQLADNELVSKSVLQAKDSSPDYLKCNDSPTVDSRFKSIFSVMLNDSGPTEQDRHPDDFSNTVKHTQAFISLQRKPRALAASSYEHELGHESLKPMDEPQHPSGLQKQSVATGKADQQQVQGTQSDGSTLEPESKPYKVNPLEANTDTQEASEEKVECLNKESKELQSQELSHVEHTVVNNILGLKPVKANKSLLAENELLSRSVLLQAKVSSPVIVVQTKTESQSIVFSDRMKEVPHQLHPRFKDTSNLSPAIKVNDVRHTRTQQKVASLRAVFERAERVEKNNCYLPPQFTDLTDTEEPFIQKSVEVEDVHSFVPELKENAEEETVDSKDRAETYVHKTLAGLNFTQHNADEHSSANKQKVSLEVLGRVEPVGEHTSMYHEHRIQPEAKTKLEGEVRKVHRPSSKHIRTLQEARAGPVKPSATKQHSSNHPSAPNRSAAATTAAQNYLHGKQLGQNRAVNALPTLSDKLFTRRSAPTRASQSPLRHSRTDPSPGRISASTKQPQAQQDKTKAIQLGQSSSRQRSASTTDDSPLSTAALFLRRVRSLKRENDRVPPKENRK
uniref:Si:dkey-27o4.1 n=1 Tax=Astyanax mexicanus TaxID=7994 RepID=A0A8B9LJD7_ASTMX